MTFSSQAGPALPFTISSVQQPFRLLELPPELLELLTSPNPPKLQFKSPEVKTHLNAPEAVLCSPNKTYVIRQQQTSNGVHVLLPSAAGPNVEQNLGVTAISQCTSSLELMQAPAGSATPNIKALLPLFDEPEDADKPYNLYHDKGYVFENTPMSDVECHQVWNHLVAFEMPPSLHLPRRCFRPSSNALSKAWLRLLDISRAEGINLAGTLRTGTMLEALWNPDEDWPHELRAAILTRLSLKSAAMSAKEHAESVLRDGSTLDRAATVQWVGLLILQSRTETEPDTPRLPKSIFLETWKDSLPEDWREDANLDALPKGCYAVAADYIRFTDGVDTPTEEAVQTSGIAKPGKAAAGNKRKWHEKFAASRKQGKSSS